MMIEWKLEKILIKDLKEHPKNPRSIGKEQFGRLNNMIDKFGLIDKPIVNRDLMIIGGHQRIKILKKKKVKEVECWIPETLLSDEEVDELCIGLNLHQGIFDYEILANEWSPLKLLDYGFTEKQLLDTYSDPEKQDKEDKKNNNKKKKECPNCGCEL